MAASAHLLAINHKRRESYKAFRDNNPAAKTELAPSQRALLNAINTKGRKLAHGNVYHYLAKKYYEDDKFTLALTDKIIPDAVVPKQHIENEFQGLNVEVNIEYGTTNVSDQAQRPDSEGNFIDCEASTMSTQQG